MSDIDEIYIPVKDFVGLYKVSNFGNVCSVRTGRILRSHKKSGEYLSVSLSKNGKVKNMWVHRLVAQAFLPNALKKKTVNHIDGDPSNNHVINLEWATPSENMAHSRNVLGNTPWKNRTVKTEERICVKCDSVFTAPRHSQLENCSFMCSDGIDF